LPPPQRCLEEKSEEKEGSGGGGGGENIYVPVDEKKKLGRSRPSRRLVAWSEGNKNE